MSLDFFYNPDTITRVPVSVFERYRLEIQKRNYQKRELEESEISELLKILKNSSLFNHCKTATLVQAEELCKDSKKIIACLVDTIIEKCKPPTSKLHLPKTTIIQDTFFVAVASLETDLGSILIRPETLTDKMADFFLQRELDFVNYPEFSKKYFFLSENKTKTLKNLKKSFLEAINQFDDLFLGTTQNRVIVLREKSFSSEIEMCNLLEFTFEIQNTLK